MTNAKILIDNAIFSVENDESYEKFSSYQYNKELSEEVGVDLKVVYEMAVYVVNTIKEYWLSEISSYSDIL